MKTCLNCHTPIEHQHLNSKYCVTCRAKPKKPVPVPKEETITISLSYFKKLQRALELYEEIEQYIDKIKETI